MVGEADHEGDRLLASDHLQNLIPENFISASMEKWKRFYFGKKAQFFETNKGSLMTRLSLVLWKVWFISVSKVLLLIVSIITILPL